MSISEITKLSVGDSLEPMTHNPISRTTLALFAGASGDHNPIHIDIDFAKVFADVPYSSICSSPAPPKN